jgi:hypothetical protein
MEVSSQLLPSWIYRVIHEVFPPLSEGIPEVIWNKKCEYTNGMQLFEGNTLIEGCPMQALVCLQNGMLKIM